MKQISKYREIRNNFVDEEDHKVYIDAWKTKNPNEEGSVIAKIDLATYEVEYLDERAGILMLRKWSEKPFLI